MKMRRNCYMFFNYFAFSTFSTISGCRSESSSVVRAEGGRNETLKLDNFLMLFHSWSILIYSRVGNWREWRKFRSLTSSFPISSWSRVGGETKVHLMQKLRRHDYFILLGFLHLVRTGERWMKDEVSTEHVSEVFLKFDTWTKKNLSS